MNEELNDGDVNLFLRIGTDYISNYYEYQIPLQVTLPGESDPENVWPLDNRIELPLELLQTAKQMRNDSMRTNNEFSYTDLYTYFEDDKIVSIKGNPNLTVIGHMTEENEGMHLITRANQKIPIQSRGWNSFEDANDKE